MSFDELNETKQNFIYSYVEALYESNICGSIEEVRELVAKILNGSKLNNKDDSLVLFIKQSLKNGVPINRLTGAELFEAFEIGIPGIKVLSDDLYIDEQIMEALEGCSYISGDNMIVFKNGKFSFCDISKCREPIVKTNKFTIKKLKEYIKQDPEIGNHSPKKLLKSILLQCIGKSEQQDKE